MIQYPSRILYTKRSKDESVKPVSLCSFSILIDGYCSCLLLDITFVIYNPLCVILSFEDDFSHVFW